MISRGLSFLFVVLLLAAGAVAAPDEEKRILIPVEEYLPASTRAFVSLPDGSTVLDLLARAGESRPQLAARLSGRAGRGIGEVAGAIETLARAADGPVTISVHRRAARTERSDTPFLITAATRRKGDHLKDAGRGLVRSLLAPLFAKEVLEENVVGHPVTHLAGEDVDLYIAHTRGFLLASSSVVLLGQVLSEMRSPSGRTLTAERTFEVARASAVERHGERFGLIYSRDPGVLPLAGMLGAETVIGFLAKVEGGYRDELTLISAGGRLLDKIRSDGEVPGVWAKSAGKGAWVGASLTPDGVLDLVMSILPPDQAILGMRIGSVAAGPVELVVRPGEAPVLKIALAAGADPAQVLADLGGNALVEDGALLLSADPALLAADRRPEVSEAVSIAGGARVAAPVAFLLSALGRTAPPGDATTVWTLGVGGGEGRAEDSAASVTVRAGMAEVGPFTAIVASLFR